MAATRAERERRLGEIEETHRPAFEIKPFRLQLVAVPSLTIPLLVRRGERAYAFRARWLLGSGAFAPERCPACGSTDALVAGRERLGCAACMPRPAANIPVPTEEAQPPPIHPDAAIARPAGKRRDRRGQAQADGHLPAKPKPRARPGGRPIGMGAHPPVDRNDERILKEGTKLATRFWDTAAAGERWPNKLMARESPARALHRLFGPAWPFAAVGMPQDEMIIRWTVTTAPPYRDLPEATTGAVLTDGDAYPYTLRWRMQEGRAVLLEILPYARVVDGRLPTDSSPAAPVARRLFVEVPHPREPLDGVPGQLWDRFLPVVGLPVVVRCLTAYWRLPSPPEASDAVLAQALVQVIARHSRRGAKRNPTLWAEVDDVGPVADELRGALKPSAACPW